MEIAVEDEATGRGIDLQRLKVRNERIGDYGFRNDQAHCPGPFYFLATIISSRPPFNLKPDPRKRKALPRLLDRACKKFLAITYSRPEGLPSAGTGLASVFGMGSGVSPRVRSPGNS